MEIQSQTESSKNDVSPSFFDKIVRLIDIKTILFILLALHLLVIQNPAKSLVFDEAYYVPAARDILNGVSSNPEHPFLGKAWISLGIVTFGDNWFGWRIVPVSFSLLSLIVFYFISKKFLGEKLATYSTALLGFENIFFIHGSLALLEIPSIFFAFLSFWLLYERGNRKFLRIPLFYWLSALTMGLSFLSKETAAFYIISIIFFYISRVKYTKYQEIIPKLVKGIVILLFIGMVYFIPVTIYDIYYKPSSSVQVLETHTIINLSDENGVITGTTTLTNTTTIRSIINNGLDHLVYTVSYASGLRITNTSKDINSGNYAWNWILPIPSYPPSPYYIENAEVKHTITENDKVISVTTDTKHPIAWYGIGNLPIWWSIWFIVPFSIFNIIKKKAKDIDYFLLIFTVGTYLPMLYISGIGSRIVYPFYFVQTVPILAIGIPHVINSLIKNKILRDIILYLFLIIALTFFILYFPLRINEL